MSASRLVARVGSVAAALVVLAAPPAHAQRGGVVVAEFTGPRAAVLRRAVVDALAEGGVAEVPLSEAQAAASERGADVGSPEVLAAVGARAYVEGRVVRARRRWGAELRVTGPDGGELASDRFASRRAGALPRQVERWVRDDVLPALGSVSAAAPPPASEPSPAPAPRSSTAASPRDDASPPPAPRTGGGIAPFALNVGFAVTHRSLGYNDDIFAELRPYDLPAAPFVTFGLEYWPGEHTDSEAFRGFSVAASGNVGLGIQSVADNGNTYPTDAWSLGVDLRYRLPVDDVTFRFDAGYAASVFTIHDAGELVLRPEIPNVETHSLRAGAGLRWSFGSGMFFEGFAAYLHPFAMGEIASDTWFPNAWAGGLDVEGGLGVVVDDVELAALFVMRRFFYDMHSEPGDARVAGGAIDETMSGNLRFTYRPSGL